jgi:hypothetical protein
VDDESLDELFDRVEPLSEKEKRVELLRYFCADLSRMDDARLGMFHEHCVARQDGSREEAMMLEIVEGQIALRQIRQLP